MRYAELTDQVNNCQITAQVVAANCGLENVNSLDIKLRANVKTGFDAFRALYSHSQLLLASQSDMDGRPYLRPETAAVRRSSATWAAALAHSPLDQSEGHGLPRRHHASEY